MQFTKIFVALAAVATSVLAADIDWTSDSTLACTKENWAAIKAASDPMLGMAGAILTPDQSAALSSLLGGASTMPANPSDDFLHALPNAIPASVLNLIAGDIVTACLQTYQEPAPSATDAPATSEEPAATSEEPAATSEEPAATDAPATSEEPAASEEPATSSAPSKCKPRA
ncbi:hypothetical protein LPJ72_000021 [Coemansia sp. Benny D160-2]|nr:hypothetical protein LPJ72_000021 [Coemansia sp. Benny D160-2]